MEMSAAVFRKVHEPLSIELKLPTQTQTISTPGENAYQLELENFCAAVRGEADPEISAEETIRNLGVLEELHRVGNPAIAVPA